MQDLQLANMLKRSLSLAPSAASEASPLSGGRRRALLGIGAADESAAAARSPGAAGRRRRVRSPLLIGRRSRKKPSVFTFDCAPAAAQRPAAVAPASPLPPADSDCEASIEAVSVSSGRWASTDARVRYDEAGDRIVWSVARASGEREEIRVRAADVVDRALDFAGSGAVRLTVRSCKAPEFWRYETPLAGSLGAAEPAPPVWVPVPDFTGEEASVSLTFTAIVRGDGNAGRLRAVVSRVEARRAAAGPASF